MKIQKPYLDEDLNYLWKAMRDQEDAFIKYKRGYQFIKKKLRLEFKTAQNKFDKILRKKERAYNRIIKKFVEKYKINNC